MKIFPEVQATLGFGPFGLIDIKTEKGLVRVNSNGFFDKFGSKITSKQAEESLGLELIDCGVGS